MAITINGTGSITGLTAGGLPDGSVTAADIASGVIPAALSNAEDGTGTDFKFNSGYGSNATAYGCRSWVKFNGDGTPTRLGNGNVSSITDRGPGMYTVHFTTSHPDANYTFAGATSTASNGDPNHIYMDDNTGQTAGSLAVNTARGLDGAIQDARNVYIVTFR